METPYFGVDLDRHNLEPIHTPGSIQPHGVILVLSQRELKILQVSENCQEYLTKKTTDLIGQPISVLLDSADIDAIAQYLQENYSGIYSLKLSISTNEGNKYFDGFIHRITNALILELEPINPKAFPTCLSLDNRVRKAIAKLQQTSNYIEFLQVAALEIRQITGYDRVMVYQFDSTNAGEVIAEAKGEEFPSYLGLHYPATDIPDLARELYKWVLLRFIPDMKARSVKLIPLEDPTTHQPLDLSLSILRSVHPCCVEYHQNMGVSAMLVISLIKDDKLWGLISCHHHSVKYLPSEIRTICEFLGQMVSAELANKVIQEQVEYKNKLELLGSEVVESISEMDNLRDALIQPEPRLLGLMGAQGAAVCLEKEITLVGATPDIEQVRALIEWADPRVQDNIFYTDSLPKLYPESQNYKDTASGLVLLQISKVRYYYILWFRPEVLRTLNWAGNPKESIHTKPDGRITLCPRKSFAQWQEIVRSTSKPWKACELESALSLKNAIAGIVLKKADELTKINLELERSNHELASFAYAASHDLKEPLRGIHNYSSILLEDYAQVLDEEGIEYLNTITNLSQRMETLINVLLKFSQLGQAELQWQMTDLNQLLDRAIEVFRASRSQSELNIRIPRSMPVIKCDPVLINEVFSNLIGNAFKYNDRPDKWVEIGYLNPNQHAQKNPLQPIKEFIFYIKDNGIGIQEHHREIIFKLFKRLHSQEKYDGGAGAGLTITKKIVERHGGEIWVESVYGVGSTFYFTL